MRKLLCYLPFAICHLLLALPAGAQGLRTTAQLGFSTCSTNPQTTLSWAVVSANAANAGTPVVQYLNAGSDKANSVVQFYRVDALTSATYSNSTLTLPVVATNGLADGGVIIIRHVLDDTYEKRVVTTSTGSTNLVVTVAPIEAVSPGDLIYHAVKSGQSCIRWGVSTNSVGPSSGSIYVGQAGYPLLLEIDAGTNGEINAVSGIYQK